MSDQELRAMARHTLALRWQEIAESDPALRAWLPQERYVARNLAAAIRNLQRKLDSDATG
jgi:hypothetical protein